MRSLEHRLQLGLTSGLVVLVALLAWLLFSALQRLSDDYLLTRLQHDAEGLLSALELPANAPPTLAEGRQDTIYDRPFSGHYYLIAVEGAVPLRSRSLWDWPGDLELRPQAVGHRDRWESIGPAGQQLLVWSAGYQKQGRQLTLLVAEDTAPLSRALADYGLQLGVLALAALVVLLLLQRRLVRRAFAPLRGIGEALGRLERGEVTTLGLEVPREVAPLVDAVNRLLRLTEQRLLRSRNALGNLTHALKQPLNLLLQLADEPRLQQLPTIAAELREQGDQLNRLIDHELRRARLAGAGKPGHYFEPAAELPALTTLLQRVHPEKPLTITCDYPEGRMAATDRDDMLELLGNLLENAANWARAEVHCAIAITDALTLTIEDDGPGVDPAQLETLTRRGARLDEGPPGHGLGLAIVSDIVDLYAGTLAFGTSTRLGGLRVTITLPLAGDLHL